MSTTTTAQPAPRVYTAADFVADQTRHLDWPALRQHAIEAYGINPPRAWAMTRADLIAAMVASEQRRAAAERAMPGRGWAGWLDLTAD